MDCVTRRGKVYCAIIYVPVDLQKLVGRKQIWRSLKTKNYSVARSQARKLLLAADQLFMQLRSKMDSRLINAMVADFGLDLLQFNDEIRLGTMVAQPHYDKDKAASVENVKNIYAEASKSTEGRSMLAANAKLMADQIQEHIFAKKPEDLNFVSGAYEIFLEKHGIPLPPFESSDEKELMSALAQTAKLAYIIEQERVQGIREESDLQHRIISKWQADLPPKKDTGIPVSELLDQYYAVWAKDYRKKPNANEYRIKRKARDIEIIKESMLEYFGKDIGVKEIDDDKASEWRDFHQADFRAALKEAAGSEYDGRSAHGLRYNHAQERLHELQVHGMSRDQAKAVVSKEMNHERPEITELYCAGK